MSKRTNTAVWQEAYSRWRVAVQKDGVRRYFYSSTPGRTGQREANRKAKLSTYLPEDVQIPAGARLKGKKVLQPDDLVKLFSIDTTLYRNKRVPDDYIHAYRFAVLTGLRPGELVGLRWADIKGSTVNISRAINVKGQETRGKNENACRSFVLPDVAKAVLEAQRAITGHCESVFCLETERRFYKRWKVYCAANDLQPVSLYELRHSFVSAIKTLPAGEVKALVGHSEDMDTYGIYSHALTGEDVQTAQAVNAVFMKLLHG